MPRTLLPQLDQHRRSLGSCRRCVHLPPDAGPVISSARRPVALLVGQAPGKVETVDRRPFAGRAGRTLFQWFARAGFDEATVRDRVYIAAMTRCYPGPHPSGRGDRVPNSLERAACGPWLDDELRLLRPRLLFLVGRLAIERFLPPTPLDRLVGTIVEADHAWGRSRVIPLPHPSGASAWLNDAGHRALVDRAIACISRELEPLIAAAPTMRRRAG